MTAVTYNGGQLLTSVQSQALYLGSGWSSLTSQITDIDAFLTMIVNSNYMDMLTNAGYNVGRGTYTVGYQDPMVISTTSGITDQQIQQEIQAQITAKNLQNPTANNLYMVYVQPGIEVHYGTSTSAANFLGYHTAFNGTDANGNTIVLHYAVISYAGAPNFKATSEGFIAPFDELTSVSSHELAESCTDPNIDFSELGWDAVGVGEIADLAANHYYDLNGYIVQCVVNPAGTVVDPTLPPPPQFPPAVTISINSFAPTQALVSWTMPTSGNISGYQVWYGIGQPNIEFGAVSVTANYSVVNGLNAGVTYAFQVISLNDAQQTKSAVVSSLQPVGIPGRGE